MSGLPSRVAARGLAVAMAALCLAGCGTPVRRPAARVVSVRLVEQTPQAARLEATVELSNPNDVHLPLLKSDYRLEAGQAAPVSLRDEPHRTLPGDGRQTVTLPMVVVRRGADLRGASYSLRGSIRYQPPGEVRELLTEAGFPLPRARFAARGQLAP